MCEKLLLTGVPVTVVGEMELHEAAAVVRDLLDQPRAAHITAKHRVQVSVIHLITCYQHYSGALNLTILDMLILISRKSHFVISHMPQYPHDSICQQE